MTCGAILLAATAARADVLPVRTVAVAAGATAYADGVGGVGEHGTGPIVEVAVGSGRAQALVEGSYEWVSLDHQDSMRGHRLRGGGGLRWIATSVSVEHASLDMILEAVGGVARTGWDGGGHVTRPDLGFGWGMQGRFDKSGHHGGFRLGIRAVFAPAERDQMAIVCRGRCTTPATAQGAGLTGLFEVTW